MRTVRPDSAGRGIFIECLQCIVAAQRSRQYTEQGRIFGVPGSTAMLYEVIENNILSSEKVRCRVQKGKLKSCRKAVKSSKFQRIASQTRTKKWEIR